MAALASVSHRYGSVCTTFPSPWVTQLPYYFVRELLP